MHLTDPDFAHCALITVDLQKDTMPGQPMEVPGTSDVIPPVLSLLTVFRDKNIPVIHLVRIYQPDGKNVELCRRQQVLEGRQLFIAGSTGAELIPELFTDTVCLDFQFLLKGGAQRIADNETIIFKPRWGGFFRTSLETILRSGGINTLVFTGCNFPNCPRATIFEASERDFKLVMITDGVSGLYQKGLEEMSNIGVNNLTAAEVIKKVTEAQLSMQF